MRAHSDFELGDQAVVAQGDQINANRVQIVDFALELERPVVVCPHNAAVLEVTENLADVAQHCCHGRAPRPGLVIGRR